MGQALSRRVTLQDGVLLIDVVASLHQRAPIRLQVQLGRFYGMGWFYTSIQSLTLEGFQSEQLGRGQLGTLGHDRVRAARSEASGPRTRKGSIRGSFCVQALPAESKTEACFCRFLLISDGCCEFLLFSDLALIFFLTELGPISNCACLSSNTRHRKTA